MVAEAKLKTQQCWELLCKNPADGGFLCRSAAGNGRVFRQCYRRVLRSTIYTLITVAAVAVLVAMLLRPVRQLHGTHAGRR